MKPSTRTILFIFALFSIGTSFSQYKFEVGLKFSSTFEEIIQLEQRFHLKSPYTLTATFAAGTRNISENTGAYSNLIDSTTVTSSQKHAMNFCTLKFGVQRSISVAFFENDILYVGLTTGFGYQQERSSYYHTNYTTHSNEPSQSSDYDETFNGSSRSEILSFRTQLSPSFGVNLPIKKRLLFTSEIGLTGMLSSYIKDSTTSFRVFPFVSSGLFYRFGKID